MDIYLHDTLTGKKKKFEPITPGKVSMYNCGPTVYNYAHIGNLRSYVFADVLRRMFEWNGYEVKQVINITDVGHLVSDSDEGEDKLEKIKISLDGKHSDLHRWVSHGGLIYQPRFCSNCDSSSAATASPFIAPVRVSLVSSNTFGSSK